MSTEDQYQKNKSVVLLIVWFALFVDNMLVTTVVPIVPAYLISIKNANWTGDNKLIATPPLSSSPTFSVFNITKTTVPSSTNETESNKKYAKKILQRQQQRRHEIFAHENVYVGIFIGSKLIAQVLSNPLIGTLTNRIGYTMPMFTGFTIVFVSTMLFAVGTNFWMLLVARSIQGVGSAFTSIAGFGILAQTYKDDKVRGKVMSVAIGGMALGLLLGAPYGGLLFELSGKVLPFVLLALLALLFGVLQLFVLTPRIERLEDEKKTIKELLQDPYIIIAACALIMGGLGWGVIEASMPLWMMEKWGAGSFEQGYAFAPASIFFFIGSNSMGAFAFRIGRWLCALIGFVVLAASYICIPFGTNAAFVMVPMCFMGFASGMVDATMLPMLGQIADARHSSVYSSIYSISNIAFCLGILIGAFISGPIVKAIGFSGIMYVIAATTLIYAPLMLFLRKIPPKSKAKDESKSNNNNNSNSIHMSRITIATTTDRDWNMEEKEIDVGEDNGIILSEGIFARKACDVDVAKESGTG